MSWSMLGLMVFTIVQIGRPQELVPGLEQVRLGLLSAGLTAAAAFAEGRLTNLAAIFQTTEMRCVLATIALGVTFAPMGVWPSGSFSLIVNDYLKVVFYFVLLQAIVRSRADLRRLIWALILSSLILGLVAFLYGTGVISGNEIRGDIGVENGVERVTVSDTYSANELALIMVCAMPFALTLSRRQGPVGLLVQFACLGLTAVIVVWTGSRTGFVLLGLVGVLVLMRIKWIRASGTMMGLIVAAGLVWAVASPAYWERLGAMVSPTTHYEETYSGRYDIWMRGLQLGLSHPIFGVGIGNFAIADEMINGERRGRSAHNSFVETWAELGFGGLVTLCVLFWASLTRARRLARLYGNEWLGACAATGEVSLISFIIGSCVLSMQYSQVLYFLVAVPLLCDRIAAGRGTAVTGAGRRR
jgi:putative inorganic carbon (HCO3(-)) transporter